MRGKAPYSGASSVISDSARVARRFAVFQIKDELRRQGVKVFSSNYALYGDMSLRGHSSLAGLAPSSEEYSIDESFLDVSGIPDLDGYACQLRKTVRMWTGIPIKD